MQVTADTCAIFHTATVVANQALCREHYRLTLRVESFAPSLPGQFVHLCPITPPPGAYPSEPVGDGPVGNDRLSNASRPLLRRAFSIAGLRNAPSGVHLDVMYRVVGSATRWMESLAEGDSLSCMGPLGNSFPIQERRPLAWLVAGGVGLPPMLWLADALHRSGKNVVAFCGARSAELLALTLDPNQPPDHSARRATPSALEFARHQVPVVISTDDGSLGFSGHVGLALAAYVEANRTATDDVVLYTCGPERMMDSVAAFCRARKIECHVCMERAMACGTGMCQSCVVPVRDEADSAGWRYRLCCTDGPIFEAQRVIWKPIGAI
ncbi:MAG: dihydroorotate dehydrogenase electron transfer subunit [Planctomycetes bacterium]|nr:dihydroorotate dehydrogenase electron transfer subunit [Planctomycetota bacterium]